MSGYIQLLACGSEKEFFHDDPQMSYFRNTYRRHTNFYIANQETPNNNIKGNPNISFVIPNDGDFLSTSYIKFDMPDNYTELFHEYSNVNTTLITNILNLYDCFTIRATKYAKSDIKEIKLFKMKINNYFTIFSSSFQSDELLTLLFQNPNIDLQTDNYHYYFNINLPYFYYAFNYYQNPFIPILDNPIANYLFSVINFSTINYIRIDLFKPNVALKITFPFPSSYETLCLIILNSIDENDTVSFKIDARELYFHLHFFTEFKQQSAFDVITEFTLQNAITPKETETTPTPKFNTPNNSLYYRLRNMLINKTNFLSNEQLAKLNEQIKNHSYKLTIIDNKVSTVSFISTEINQILDYVKSDSATYLNLNMCTEIPAITLYRFSGNNYFFGNYDNIDFNSALIADETVIINNNAFSNNNMLSMNVFLKLFVTYFCLNVPPTIQNYLTFVNTNKTQSVAKYYSNNVSAFNNLTIQVLFNPNILVLNYDNLQSILYQKEIKDLYATSESTTNLIIPYINRKPFLNSEIVINRYIYDGAIQFINTIISSTFDLTENIVNSLILLNLSKNKNNISLYGNLLYNYNINNFVFDSVESNLSISTIIIDSDVVTLLYYFNFVSVVINSINEISNIYGVPQQKIYEPIGFQSEIILNTEPIGSVFPMSSNLFQYIDSNNNITTFNVSQQKYLIKLLDLINNKIITAFNEYKINYNETITLPIIESFTLPITNDFNQIVTNFYNDSEIDVTATDFALVNSFFDALVVTDFDTIYNIDLLGFNLNYFVLNAMFDYVDFHMFNGAFNNNLNVVSSTHYGVKFLFEINAPLYRIYYLFCFLAFMSVDDALINIMPFDLVTLRDLALNFILQILNNFNGLNYVATVFGKYNIYKFDLTLTYLNRIFIANNFLCYDSINVLNNVTFNENTINIYNAFFFIKNIIDITNPEPKNIPTDNQVNYTNWQNILFTSLYDSIKNDYDNSIVNIFIKTIILNKKYFKNIEPILQLVSLFLDKNNLNFSDIVTTITLIVNSYNQYNNYGNLTYNPIVFSKNPIYYNDYYTTFSIGSLFDNATKLMISTINTTYNIVSSTLNNINTNYFTMLEPSIKQYQNVITQNNSFDLFTYIKTIFYEVGVNYGFNVEFYYNNLITEFNKYLLYRLQFINKYVIKPYVFEECLTILDKFVLLFNNKNKTTIDIYSFYGNGDVGKTYVDSRLIIIYLLYLSLLQQCLKHDVDLYIQDEAKQTVLRFEEYLVQKYTYNIYIQCMDDILDTLKADITTIFLDYATINIYNSPTFNTTTSSDISEFKTYFNEIATNDGLQGNFKTLVNYFGNFTRPTYSQTNIIYGFIETDIMVFQNLQKNINSLISQNNKLLFTIFSHNNLSLVSSSVNDIVNNSFQKSFEVYKANFYTKSQILLETIYEGLNGSFDFDLITNTFSRRIVNYSMNIVKNYFGENNYFKTIYYEQFAPSAFTSLPITDLCVFTTTYLNNVITKSMRMEGGINRIIYYYLTQYAISIANPSLEFVKTHSLYDYVRMFKPIYAKAMSKTYETNLALVQNEQVFELLNFNNFAENISFSQNAYFNDLLMLIGTDLATPYLAFYDFIVLQNQQVFNDFRLSDGINVFQHFTISPIEQSELDILFYDFVVSNQYFSPYHIYNEIIAFKQPTNNLTAQYTMDFDNIKKKIVVYLFVMFLIYTNIPNMINKKTLLGARADYYLEYNFPDNTIVFKISDAIGALNSEFIIDIETIVMEYIQKMFNDAIPTQFYPTIIQNSFNALPTMRTEFVQFAKNFVSSFDITIGTENINTTTLLANTFEQIFTISNNVKNINIILNNDIDQLNPDSYGTTIYTYNKMNMFYEQQLFSMNNPNQNNIATNTAFSVSKHIFYNRTDIDTINFIYNAVITYLNYFDIVDETTDESVNSIINYLRYFGKSSVNEVLELLKGVTTNNLISLDFINDGFNIQNLNINMFSRAQNIKNLSILSTVSPNEYDMSIIAPNDYDFNTNNITFYQIYNDFREINIYKKYYNLQYNFYNFPDNDVVVYVAKYKYYQNVLANSNAINNIKSAEPSTFIQLLNDIYFTLVANGFYPNIPIIDSSVLFVAMNSCVTLYLKYNFSFRINTNLTNIQNLRLQADLQKTNSITTLTDLTFYVKKLYYYEIFSSNIILADPKTVEQDFIDFMAQLTILNNYNFIYRDWIVNYVYRFQIIIVTLFTFIKSKYGIEIMVGNGLSDIMPLLVLEIANNYRIRTFFNTIYVNYGNTIDAPYQTINDMLLPDYLDFVDRFRQAVSILVYYTDNYGISYIYQYAYNSFFLGKTFKYRVYAGDSFKVYDFILSEDVFKRIYYDYMLYFVNTVKPTLFKTVFVQWMQTVMELFANKLINFDKLITLLEEDVLGEQIESNGVGFSLLIYNIAIIILTDNYWGLIHNSNSVFFQNRLLPFQIYYLNLLFATLSNSTYFLQNIYLQNVKLQQLYTINILLLTVENTNNPTYSSILEQTLVKTHTIIFNGLFTNTVNETNDICVYFDYLNRNIIQNNRIENYYKNVQNETIKNVLFYNILEFGNNDVKNNFLIDIYNEITTHLISFNETNMGLLYFNNTIVSILNNYRLEKLFDNIVINNENVSYVNTIIRNVFIEIYQKLDAYKNVFGTDDPLIDSMFINTNLVFNIFNKQEYVFNDRFVTILTFVYANFANTLGTFNYDIAVILFYYNCLITFLLRYGEQYDMLNKIVYFLVNLINNNIIDFVNGVSEHTEFFDGLTDLMENKENYIVEVYARNCYTFFNTLLHNLFWTTYSKNFLHTALIQKSNLRAFNQFSDISISTNVMNNKVTNTFIYNAKINTWKNLLSVAINYNQSNFIKNMKSVMFDGCNIINVQEEYVSYVEKINGGLINKYGILQMVNYVSLLFGDQLVDRLTNEIYKVILDLFTNVNKLSGLNEMLGITGNNILNGLKPYIKKHQGRVFYLPLNFFFERILNAIPLIACIHLDVSVNLFMQQEKYNTLYKNTMVVNDLLRLGDFQTALYSNYFLIEREERKQVASRAINNLIEKHMTYSLSKTVQFNNEELVFVQFDFEMTNAVKELIWFYDFSLNNYKLAHNIELGSQRSNSIRSDFSTLTTSTHESNIYDYLVNVVFYMDGMHRDGMEILTRTDRNEAITEYINKYKYCTRASPNNKYNNYSFSLKPEEFQPSGAINMSRFSVFRIELVFDSNGLLDYLGKFDKITNFNSLAVTVHLQTLEYNEMVYRSGLAGLGFSI